MAQVLIIEPIDDVYNELVKFLEGSAADVEPVRFKSSSDLLEWIKLVEESRIYADRMESDEGDLDDEPPENLLDLDKIEVGLIISNADVMGPLNHRLFKKIGKYLKQNELLVEEAEYLPILFLDRDTPDFSIGPYLKPEYSNVLLKPLDRTVSIGKINWALLNEAAADEEQLHKEAPPEPVEILKNVGLVNFTELGFTSTSTRQIKPGALARYYLDFLDENGDDEEGIFAKCVGCDPDPNQAGNFITTFTYFAASAEKIRRIKKYIEAHETKTFLPLKDTAVIDEVVEMGADNTIKISVISEDEILGNRITDYLSSNFTGFEVFQFQNLVDFHIEAVPEMMKADRGKEDDEEEESGALEAGKIIFDASGANYLRTEPEISIDGMCGLSRPQISKFRSIALNSCTEKERGKLLEYFKQPMDDPLVLAVRDQKQTRMITIEMSEKVEDNVRKEQHVYIRLSTPEEALEYAQKNKSPAAATKIIFMSDRLGKILKPRYLERLKRELAGKNGNPHEIAVFLAGPGPLPSHVDMLDLMHYNDYFVEPFDPPYLERKVKQAFPDLPVKEPMSRMTCRVDAQIKTGVPYELEYISELSFCAKYYRPIDKHRYRFLVLTSEAEERREEFLVKCVNATEAKDDEGEIYYKNYFQLYGLGDAQNQFVRLWLNETYKAIAADKEKLD